MRKLVQVGTAVIVLALPLQALAANATPKHHGATTATTATPSHVAEYRRLYREVAHAFGRRAPGRNIVRYGFSPGKPSTDAQVLKSIGVLEGFFASPPVHTTPLVTTYAQAPQSERYTYTPTAPTVRTYSTSPATQSYGGGHYSIPSSIVQCESGGNYGAVNPSSGAGGAYQIMPSTWQAYGGTGLPQNASPAEQDRIAARVWAGQGRSAWSC